MKPPERKKLIDFIRETTGINGQFVIPVFQRNYTWEADTQVKQYLDDINEIITKKYEKHFLGIIIYSINDSDILKRQEFSIIDGQQRLTTTFLIMYAIRDILKEKGNQGDLETLEDNFITIPQKKDDDNYKMKASETDDGIFRKITLGKEVTESDINSNIYKSFFSIKKYFAKMLDIFSLKEILNSLNKLYVVGIPLSSTLDNAQRIFESINSTGAELKSSDLIRNFLLMNINNKQQEELYENFWRKIETNLNFNSQEIEEFFRLFLSTQTFELSTSSKVYEEFKKWIKNSENEKLNFEDLKKIFSKILLYSKFYNTLFVKKIKLIDPKIKNAIQEFRISTSKIKTPRPFILGAMAFLEEDKISSNDFNNMINLVISYMTRRSLAGFPINVISRLFPQILKNIFEETKNGNNFNIFNFFKEELIEKNKGKGSRMPLDEEIRENLQNKNVYSSNLKNIVKNIFEKIENSNNNAPVDLSKLNIEHIMPQASTEYWLKHSLIIQDKNFHEYEIYSNKIGNLTLASISDNNKMQNNSWEIKKDILKKTSHLKINEDILKKEKWTYKDIDKRTNEIIDLIIKLYPY